LFRRLKAIFVVESKGDGSNDDSSVSESELHIGVPVRLAELEAVQVVLEGIVGCVLAGEVELAMIHVVSGRAKYQKHYKAIFWIRLP
jgi:hypothetical protein